MGIGAPWRTYLPPGLTLLVVVGLLVVSYGYPPQSRAMPVLVGWTMVALLLLDLASRTPTTWGRTLLLRLNPAVVIDAAATVEPTPRSLRPIVSIVLFGIGLGLLGTLIAVFAYVALALRLHGRHSLLASAVAASATLFFVYGLFSLLLKLPLFPGLLFGGAFS